MGPEVLAALMGPVLGGTIGVMVFLSKKNTDMMAQEFLNLNGNVRSVERKVDELNIEVLKNYVTNDVLTNHVNGEEEWHVAFNRELIELKMDVREMKTKLDNIENTK